MWLAADGCYTSGENRWRWALKLLFIGDQLKKTLDPQAVVANAVLLCQMESPRGSAQSAFPRAFTKFLEHLTETENAVRFYFYISVPYLEYSTIYSTLKCNKLTNNTRSIHLNPFSFIFRRQLRGNYVLYTDVTILTYLLSMFSISRGFSLQLVRSVMVSDCVVPLMVRSRNIWPLPSSRSFHMLCVFSLSSFDRSIVQLKLTK